MADAPELTLTQAIYKKKVDASQDEIIQAARDLLDKAVEHNGVIKQIEVSVIINNLQTDVSYYDFNA